MAKPKTHYSCQNCGQNSPRWVGRCQACGEWNTMVEEKEENLSKAHTSTKGLAAIRNSYSEKGDQAAWVDLDGEDADPTHPRSIRWSSGITELDRVLGGGIVRDSFILLGGDPGIGKSTILLQMANTLKNNSNQPIKILYVSGEESIEQIRSRAKRLGIKGDGKVFLASETLLERVFADVKELEPNVLILDSLQTFASGELESAPGSVSQLREVSARLMTLAKSAGINVWMVGHVTKDGSIAGPKVVEHMVDTVLYFEGDPSLNYRLLRTVKNRFGSTNELGVFEMDENGLRQVDNPSSLFLSERSKPVFGTAITCSLEGTRPLLVELEALVSPSAIAVPRRTSVGMDSGRISILAAVLERHMKVGLAEYDLFFNVAGGLKLSEPSCDLAAASAIWSSYSQVALPEKSVCMGEVGLTGEIRRVSHIDLRIQEALKLGFKTLILPARQEDRWKPISLQNPKIRFVGIEHISELPKKIRSHAQSTPKQQAVTLSP